MRRNSGKYHKVKTSGNLITRNGSIIVKITKSKSKKLC